MVPGALLALLPVASVLVRTGIPTIPTTLLQQPETNDITFEKNFPQKLRPTEFNQPLKKSSNPHD
jgi:hypothetical protein